MRGRNGWKEATLEELVFFQRGYDITKSQQKSGVVPVISSSGVSSFHDEPMAPGPGVVVGRKGTIGSIHLSEVDYWPHDTTLWSRNLYGNDARFVYYYLHTIDLKRFDVGNSNPTINRNHIHKIPVRIPSREVQSEIADRLSLFDKLIENNRRRIVLLEESARLLYREWFVHLRFPGYEHVKVVDGVPEGWGRTFMPDLIAINPTERIDRAKEAWYVPMAALSETGMVVDRGDFELRTSHTAVKFRNRDVLLARITPCLENGKTAFVYFLDEDEVACGSTEFIVLRGMKVSSYFVYCLSRTYDFREHAIKSMIGSSGRQRVQTSCFSEYLIPLPPDSLLRYFDCSVEPMFEKIMVLQRENEKLSEARDLLLPRLMSGEIQV